jgi:hypothetical protein
VDTRRPESRHEVGVSAPGARQTLVELLSDYLGRRPLDAEVEREHLVALGKRYMDEVELAQREE